MKIIHGLSDDRIRSTKLLGLCAALCAFASLACAPVAGATQHDYCLWDGSYCSNDAGVLYFQQGSNYLTDNHAWLPFQPTLPTIFCGAHLNGSQYAGYTSGNPSCDHPYGGGNLLKADEYVDRAATTHASITY
jgi:hypothetical protein